ncbi:MAG: CDP-alcohol phosphatidyltransferase family protein [Desulfohalobiaceae bacterium]|nr:CDP-alcohol phosphatidyltransferase family protein [Desulfohalobiaceae bacterium]
MSRPGFVRDLFNPPNCVTLSGFGFIFLYVLAAGNQQLGFALACLFLAGFSDVADGYLAKKTGNITVLGAILDPLRDRVLFLALIWHLILLQGLSLLLCWQFFLILIFEALIVLVNIVWFRIHERIFVHVLGKTRQLVNVLFFVALVVGLSLDMMPITTQQIKAMFLIPAGFSLLALMSYAARWKVA